MRTASQWIRALSANYHFPRLQLGWGKVTTIFSRAYHQSCFPVGCGNRQPPVMLSRAGVLLSRGYYPPIMFSSAYRQLWFPRASHFTAIGADYVFPLLPFRETPIMLSHPSRQ